MILAGAGKVVATAPLSRRAAGSDNGAWIVSSYPAWRFTTTRLLRR